MAEKIIESGMVNCVSISRPFIREPDLVKKFKAGEKTKADCTSCRGCINQDENGKNHIYCKQLKKGGQK